MRYVVRGAFGAEDKFAVLLARVAHWALFSRIAYRGLSRIMWLPWFRSRVMSVEIGDAKIFVPVFDRFWGEYFFGRRDYEPEVRLAIERLLPCGRATFLDCGANYGFWSARVASGEFGEHEVIAVEASKSTFDLLQKSVGDRAVNAAVSDTCDVLFFAEDGPHQARGLAATGGVAVTGLTIDSLDIRAQNVLVKLDVEGAEESAIRGAEETIESCEIAFLYEDHASDGECRSSVAMWNAGLITYYLDPVSGLTSEVRIVEEVRAIKSDPGMGYNFIAVKPGGRYSQVFNRP